MSIDNTWRVKISNRFEFTRHEASRHSNRVNTRRHFDSSPWNALVKIHDATPCIMFPALVCDQLHTRVYTDHATKASDANMRHICVIPTSSRGCGAATQRRSDATTTERCGRHPALHFNIQCMRIYRHITYTFITTAPWQMSQIHSQVNMTTSPFKL